jgi:hypothetical protein
MRYRGMSIYVKGNERWHHHNKFNYRNASAELARIYEIILWKFRNELSDKKNVDEYIINTFNKWSISWGFQRSKLSDEEKLEWDVHKLLNKLLHKWTGYYGELDLLDDNNGLIKFAPTWQANIDMYWNLSKTFYGIYQRMFYGVLADNHNLDDVKMINKKVNDLCYVELNFTEYNSTVNFEIRDVNSHGFLWASIAADFQDMTNLIPYYDPKEDKTFRSIPKIQRCANPYCFVVFGHKTRVDVKTCGSTCRTYISRNKEVGQSELAYGIFYVNIKNQIAQS